MANSEFTSQEKQEMYRLLVLLHGALNFIVLRLQELASVKILSSKYLKEMTEITQQVQKYLSDSVSSQ
jgi:hypothetical protein